MIIYFPTNTVSENYFRISTPMVPRQDIDLNEAPKERRYRHSATNYSI